MYLDKLLPRAVMWHNFLGSYVTESCFRACWEAWLPYDIDLSIPGFYEVYADVYVNPDEVFSQPSSTLCERLLNARSFQRCYISQCAGLNASVPTGAYVTKTSEENKLWAWTSEYVARYGPGPSSFENYRFLNFVPTDASHKYTVKGQDHWKPFPVGLTAACVTAPDEVFTGHVSSAGLRRTMDLTSASNRISTPQSLRKVLLPIWTSPNLVDLWGWTMPQYWDHKTPTENTLGSAEAEFEEPRQLADIREKIIPTYVWAWIAYGHLLYMTSQSRRLHTLALQSLVNILLPFFPLIQVLHNVIDAALMMLDGEPFEYSYLLAGVLGTVISDSRAADRSSSEARLLSLEVNEVSVSRSEERYVFWWLGILGTGCNTIPLLMTVAQYCSRLTYRFHDRTYCAATGFDHRLGWIALSSFVPIVATMILYARNHAWTLSQFARQRPLENDWTPRVALQIFAATVTLELLIRLTGRVTVLQVIFSRWLKDKTQYILMAISLIATVTMTAWAPLALRYSNANSRLRKTAPWVFLSIACFYAILVFLLQTFMDCEEYADLALGFVLPWNFRWEFPSPGWTKWWSL